MSDFRADFDITKHQLLKSDHFGSVSREYSVHYGWLTFRDTSKAPWWTRFIARYLAKREAAALNALPQHPSIPSILHWDGTHLLRSWIEGQAMQIAKPSDKEYFSKGLKLLRFLHRHNIAHNDLSKETNWLVTPEGEPALVDFQLARHFKKRTHWFRNSAREDIRYLLKHKRGFCPAAITNREKRILSTPSLSSRIWKKSGKKVYLFVTRRILNWQDREGAYDRTEAKQAQTNHNDKNSNS